MKVLIADTFEQSGIDGLKACGCEVVYEPDLKDDALAEAIPSSGAQVLVVRSTKVTAPMLDAGKLSLIVRAGAASTRSTWPRRPSAASTSRIVPGKNAIAVAELDVCAAARDRSARPRKRVRAPRGQVEQEGVLEGAGSVRPDAWPARVRQHRPGSRSPRPRVRHAGDSSGAGGSRRTRARRQASSGRFGVRSSDDPREVVADAESSACTSR